VTESRIGGFAGNFLTDHAKIRVVRIELCEQPPKFFESIENVMQPYDILYPLRGVLPSRRQILPILRTGWTQHCTFTLVCPHSPRNVVPSASPFEHFEVPPFTDHPQKLFVSILAKKSKAVQTKQAG
jgi:hypothetical protein